MRIHVDLVLAMLVASLPMSVGAQSRVRFACIGDYGSDSPGEGSVAALVNRWNPDFVVTGGNNSYFATPIDDAVGKYYARYIGGYTGSYGSGAGINRFFPCLGDHDWTDDGGLNEYLSYFDLPGAGVASSGTSGNERYYDFIAGPVHLFMIDNYFEEADGYGCASKQALWLQERLAASTARWKIVVAHVPPYSSGPHGSHEVQQWHFRDWGASAVISAHDHVYERLLMDGFPYFVNGLGGRPPSAFGPLLPDSRVRYNAANGAMRIDASPDSLLFRFYSVKGGSGGTLVDEWVMTGPPPVPSDAVLVPMTATWKFLDDGIDPGSAWRDVSFDDSAWHSGRAELGYGDAAHNATVNCGPSAPACTGPNFITTWFRNSFTIVDPWNYFDFRVRLQRDDGAILYLNGDEILRTNMPEGVITPSTLALAVMSGSDEVKLATTQLPGISLRIGLNVVAVEVHQAHPYSSDVRFAMEARATRRTPIADADPNGKGIFLEPCAPNPPHPVTWIRYALPRSTPMTLRLFDVAGRLVRVVADGPQLAGRHALSLDTRGLPPGVYIYRLETADFRAARKLVVVR